MKIARLIFLSALALILSSSVIFAEEKAPSAKKASRKDMTNKEMAADIVKNLNKEDEILNFIPGLKKEADAMGNVSYTYEGRQLEGLDRGVLDKIFIRVRNEALRIRTDKLNRQLESINRAQQAERQAQQIERIDMIANPPAQPPRPPQTPPSNYQVPKVPPAPPAPVRR